MATSKATKNASAKKPAGKKAATKKTVAAKSVKNKPSRKVGKSFVPKEAYSAMVKGLMDQGLERDDAIETLKVGLRQANGQPVPVELLRQDSLFSAENEGA